MEIEPTHLGYVLGFKYNEQSVVYKAVKKYKDLLVEKVILVDKINH